MKHGFQNISTSFLSYLDWNTYIAKKPSKSVGKYTTTTANKILIFHTLLNMCEKERKREREKDNKLER